MTDPVPPIPVQTAEPAAEEAGPGALLGAERRRQGLSLGDIARQLKLSVRQIEALERDDYAAFSGLVFVRGFLRNYAKLLQVDADSLLVALPAVAAGPAPSAEAAALPEGGSHPGRLPLSWLAGAAGVLVLLVLAAMYEGRQHRAVAPAPPAAPPAEGAPSNPVHAESPPPGPGNTAAGGEPAAGEVPAGTQTAPAAALPPAPGAAPLAPPAPPVQAAPPAAAPAGAPPAPAPAAPAAQVASAGGGGELRLRFEAESWVEVKDGSGAILLSRLNRPGSEQVVQGQPPLTVVVGNAHGVQLRYQGRMVDLAPHTRVDVARLVLE
jgi:cytoskeleton protein RodZ